MSLQELVATLHKRVGQLRLELSICPYHSERVWAQWQTIHTLIDSMDDWFEKIQNPDEKDPNASGVRRYPSRKATGIWTRRRPPCL